MAWCHQATSYYLSKRWSRSMSPYGITRPHWVNTRPLPRPWVYSCDIIPVGFIFQVPYPQFSCLNKVEQAHYMKLHKQFQNGFPATPSPEETKDIQTFKVGRIPKWEIKVGYFLQIHILIPLEIPSMSLVEQNGWYLYFADNIFECIYLTETFLIHFFTEICPPRVSNGSGNNMVRHIWCDNMATSRYLNQGWPNSLMLLGITTISLHKVFLIGLGKHVWCEWIVRVNELWK